MPREPVSYQESTGWPAWVSLITVLSLGAAGAGVWLAPAVSARAAALVTASFVAFVAVLWALLGRLEVQVTRSELRVGFGPVGLIRKQILLADIAALEPVTYSPIREFGGWGIRYGKGGKRAWTIRGNRAVRLELRDGNLFYVGSERPERLAERIRSAGGGRKASEDERS